MSSMFQRAVGISPPKVAILRSPGEADAREFHPWDPDEKVAVVSFRMTVEDLVDSELLQVVPVAVAKQEVGLLLQQTAPGPAGGEGPVPEATEVQPGAEPAVAAQGLQPGTLVAEGEVVVVNENFGVRITHIISPAERLKYLR